MSTPKPVQLGLCCLNITMRKQKPTVFSSRSVILRTLEEKGFNVLKEKIIQNLKDTIQLIEWNEAHGIRVFRLSSNLFPHFSNPKAEEYPINFALPLLKAIGDKAKEYNHRITFHPGQYNVVGTPNKKMFQQTIRDLSYHADMLDYMGMGKDSVMVVHGGGMYGDKELTKNRWCEQYAELPDEVRERLVLENCEKCFSIEDCLEISEKVNIPVVFDTHHFECYKLLHHDVEFKKASEYIPQILETWKRRDIKPKFHVSEQGRGRIGHHSDYVYKIPEYLLEIPEKYGVEIDIMIESKKKELAIMNLYNIYPFLNCKLKK